jgi:hypothetical protein
MLSEQVVALIGGVAFAIIMWRSVYRPIAAPRDIQLFERRYGERGLRVVAVRRVGTEWSSGLSLNGRQPIRKYEVDVVGPNGHRETRVRGLSRGDLSQDRVWRYDHHGRRERLH